MKRIPSPLYSTLYASPLHFTLYTPHSTLYTPHSTLPTLLSPLCTHTPHYNMLYSPCITFHTFPLYTLHFALYTPQSTLHSLPWYSSKGKIQRCCNYCSFYAKSVLRDVHLGLWVGSFFLVEVLLYLGQDDFDCRCTLRIFGARLRLVPAI